MKNSFFSFLLFCLVLGISSGIKADIKTQGVEDDCSLFDSVIDELSLQDIDFVPYRTFKKQWSFFVYIPSRNDLYPFLKTNTRQMLEVGSNERINIVIAVYEPSKKGTQYFYIEKNNAVLIYQDTRPVNSGDPQAAIDFCRFALPRYPAEHYAWIFWDHGSGGSIDPHIPRSFDASELLSLIGNTNRLNNKNPLKVPFFEPSPPTTTPHRGCCFDDMYKSYINNQGLVHFCRVVKQELLHGKNWDLVGFDTCLMADVATASIFKDYANIMVASEDVEPGTGWNYRLVLSPFLERNLSPTEFAIHIVDSYAQAYSPFTNDYTQSAFNLKEVAVLEHNISEISHLLIECLRLQKGRTVKDALHISCHRKICTCFDEPSYKDLGHLYSNILKNSDLFQFENEAQGSVLRTTLKTKLKDGLNQLKKVVIANNVGKALGQAQGISIYLPEVHIHSSFKNTTFASNRWHDFIKHYLTP